MWCTTNALDHVLSAIMIYWSLLKKYMIMGGPTGILSRSTSSDQREERRPWVISMSVNLENSREPNSDWKRQVSNSTPLLIYEIIPAKSKSFDSRYFCKPLIWGKSNLCKIVFWPLQYTQIVLENLNHSTLSRFITMCTDVYRWVMWSLDLYILTIV